MKKLSKTLCCILFICIDLVACQAKNDPEIDFFFNEFVRDETAYQYQEIKLPRSSFEKPVTIQDQINYLIGDNIEFVDAMVVVSHSTDIEYQYYENASDILGKDPIFFSFDNVNNTIQRKYFEPNTIVHLGYDYPNGKKGYLTMHFRTRGFMNKTLFTRTSLMISSFESEDYLSYGSATAPVVISYLTAFDTKDMSKEMKEYEKVHSSVNKKLRGENNFESFTELEYQVLVGMREEVNPYYELDYCDSLYKNARYYDAFAKLYPAFYQFKRYAKDPKSEISQTFYDVCYKMGMSKLYEGGFNESANYYLGLAAYGSPKYKEDYQKFIKSERTTRSEYIENGNLTVGELLSVLFDVQESNLSNGIGYRSDNTTEIKTSGDVWRSDVTYLCDNYRLMAVSYSKANLGKKESSADQSRLCYSNTILITSEPIDENLSRINILIPNFRLNDVKNGLDNINRPLHHSIVIGRTKGMILSVKPSVDDIQNLYDKGLNLKSQHRAFEAMLIFRYIHDLITTNYLKDSKSIFENVTYECGFTLAEIGEEEKAIPYLEECYSSTDNLTYRQEFLSMLSNLTDPRTVEYIRKEINLCKDHNITDQKHLSLLNRRLAYVLIEYGELKEAEALLNELLKDPESAEFAKRELDYIRDCRLIFSI